MRSGMPMIAAPWLQPYHRIFVTAQSSIYGHFSHFRGAEGADPVSIGLCYDHRMESMTKIMLALLALAMATEVSAQQRTFYDSSGRSIGRSSPTRRARPRTTMPAGAS
jgi:hypothetical protein